jgi:hypothetical protein
MNDAKNIELESTDSTSPRGSIKKSLGPQPKALYTTDLEKILDELFKLEYENMYDDSIIPENFAFHVPTKMLTRYTAEIIFSSGEKYNRTWTGWETLNEEALDIP